MSDQRYEIDIKYGGKWMKARVGLPYREALAVLSRYAKQGDTVRLVKPERRVIKTVRP